MYILLVGTILYRYLLSLAGLYCYAVLLFSYWPSVWYCIHYWNRLFKSPIIVAISSFICQFLLCVLWCSVIKCTCFKGLFLLISIYPLQFYFFNIFFMWTTLKVFIEFVTTLLLFYVLIFWHWTMWDRSASTRGWSSTPVWEGEVNYWTSREDSSQLSCGYYLHMIYFSILLLSIYLYIWIQNVSSIGSI